MAPFSIYRSDTLCCLVLSCVAVSGIMVLLSLNLQTSPLITNSPIVRPSKQTSITTIYTGYKPVNLSTNLLNNDHEAPLVRIRTDSVKPPNPVTGKGDHSLAVRARGRAQPGWLSTTHSNTADFVISKQNNSKLTKSHPSNRQPPLSETQLNSRLTYLMKHPPQHMSSQRRLASNTRNRTMYTTGYKAINETQRTLGAIRMRNTIIVDDTAAQFASKHDVLPLVAFIDTRQRYSHSNATVILVQVRDTKKIHYNRIIGCGIDNIRAVAFRVKPLFVYRNWIHANVPNLSHSEAVVTCYDLPTVNGSKAFVLYRRYKVPGVLQVYSERPVILNPPSVEATPHSIVVCTTVYGSPPWLSHWLRYQQTIGVDYIHLYAQQSFIDNGGMEDPELQKLLADERLIVDLRSTHLNSSEVYYYSQPLYYQDCLLRYRGVYDFAMLIDTDDFFVPRVANQPDIHYYLDQFFPGTMRTASVKLDWIRYFPSCGLRTPLEEITDGNVTHHLSTYSGYKEYVKSIHRLEYVTEAAVHEVTYIMPGYKKSIASNSTAYFAHIRKTNECNAHAQETQLTNMRQYEDT